MKNWWKGLFLVPMMWCLICGCGVQGENGGVSAEDAEHYVKLLQETLAETTGYTAEFEALLTMQEEETTSTKGTVVFLKEPLYAKVEMDMDFGDVTQKYALYLEEEDEVVNQYMNYDGEWTEMTMQKENALSGIRIYDALTNMQMFLQTAQDWKVEEAEAGKVLTAVIPAEKFYEVEEQGRLFQLAGMSGLSKEYFSEIADVPVSLTIKENVPTGYAIDLTAALETVTNRVLKELGSTAGTAPVVVKEYKITSSLTQWDNVVAEEIPLEAKSDAINFEKEISLLSLEP